MCINYKFGACHAGTMRETKDTLSMYETKDRKNAANALDPRRVVCYSNGVDNLTG